MTKVQKNEYRFRAMGTEFLFRIYSDFEPLETAKCEAAAHAGIARVRELENKLSEFKPTSCLGRINHAVPGESTSVSSDFARVFGAARSVRARTKNAFDPFVKSSVLIKDSDYFWNESDLFFQKLHPGLKLSFGAIGKGFALDEVAGLLRAEGFLSFVISAGGSSFIRSAVEGLPDEDRIFWVLGKDAEEKEGGYSGTWLEANRSILSSTNAYSVSAEYERGSHILGLRQEQSMIATLVAHKSACLSDALATAFFVAGWEGVSAWGGESAFLSIDHEKIPAWNTEALRHFQIPREWTEKA